MVQSRNKSRGIRVIFSFLFLKKNIFYLCRLVKGPPWIIRHHEENGHATSTWPLFRMTHIFEILKNFALLENLGNSKKYVQNRKKTQNFLKKKYLLLYWNRILLLEEVNGTVWKLIFNLKLRRLRVRLLRANELFDVPDLARHGAKRSRFPLILLILTKFYLP